MSDWKEELCKINPLTKFQAKKKSCKNRISETKFRQLQCDKSIDKFLTSAHTIRHYANESKNAQIE